MERSTTNQVALRPPHSEAELITLLKLRYRVFTGEATRVFLTPNGHAIDVDRFDVNAHHLGLFNDDAPIGYARMITFDRGPQARWIDSITGSHSLQIAPGHDDELDPLPALYHGRHFPQLRDWVINRLKRGEVIVEPSRLSIDAAWRSVSVGHFMLRRLVRYTMSSRFDSAILSCSPTHASMYVNHGFRMAPETHEIVVRGV